LVIIIAALLIRAAPGRQAWVRAARTCRQGTSADREKTWICYGFRHGGRLSFYLYLVAFGKCLYREVVFDEEAQQTFATSLATIQQQLAVLTNTLLEKEVEPPQELSSLEKALIEKPDVKTLNELNDNLLEGYIILSNIERTTSTEEANEITNGFIVNIPRIEAISVISSGPTAEEYYLGKKSRYTRRALVKVPTLEGLTMLGQPPTKGYFLSYYLTKDTVQDNVLIYREATKGREFITSYLKKWRENGDGT